MGDPGIIAVLVATGLATGFLSGLLGVGGTVVMLPVMVYLLRLDLRLAIGTSLAVVVPTALFGALTHLRFGNIRWSVMIFIAAGSIAGSILGAHAAQAVPAQVLKKIFAGVMMLTAIKMLLDK